LAGAGNAVVSLSEDDEPPRIEQALRKSEERFRQVVASAPSAMVMIGGSGRIVMVDAQAEKLFGYWQQEMLGQPIEMLVPQRFRSNHPRLLASFFANPVARPSGGISTASRKIAASFRSKSA
jgi:two-component system, sensor histidine kinase PdtaS